VVGKQVLIVPRRATIGDIAARDLDVLAT
jgi:hypothetical protein